MISQASTMPTFVALLRGVNVGRAKRLRMADFRALLSGLGYADVVTLLNSGNAVFRSARGAATTHAARIAAALSAELDLEVKVVVKTADELADIVAENPIEAEMAQHSRLLVAFTQDRQALTDLKAIHKIVAPPERFAIGRNAAYFFCPAGILQSRAGEALLGRLGSAATTRNWTTTRRLHALASESDA